MTYLTVKPHLDRLRARIELSSWLPILFRKLVDIEDGTLLTSSMMS